MEVKIWSLCSVSSTLSQSNLEQPFWTLAIKWEVNMLLNKPSCVVYSCVCLWCCVVVMLNDDVDDYITICFSSWPHGKTEKKRKEIIPRLWKRKQKLRNIKVMLISIVIGVFGTWTGRYRNKWTSGDYPNYDIVEIG